jgi:hypothetical protein
MNALQFHEVHKLQDLRKISVPRWVRSLEYYTVRNLVIYMSYTNADKEPGVVLIICTGALNILSLKDVQPNYEKCLIKQSYKLVLK